MVEGFKEPETRSPKLPVRGGKQAAATRATPPVTGAERRPWPVPAWLLRPGRLVADWVKASGVVVVFYGVAVSGSKCSAAAKRIVTYLVLWIACGPVGGAGSGSNGTRGA